MRANRALQTLAFAAAALAGITGCSSTPVATPPAPSPSSSAGTLPHSGAPKVEHPLPASALSGDPCQEALTSAQLKEILGTAPQGARDDSAVGPACNWHADAAVGVSYATQTHEGLSAVYKNTKPQSKVWRPLPAIQGFPAVGHAPDSSDTPNDFCQVSVGIRDDLSFDTSLFLSSGKVGKADPCELAAQVAGMVVTNLRARAGA
ncbi:DUF3558 domain-containing protein [Amycolatopsis sp. NPDC049253]|uniref:DUF3558 domain-containing protein n=1 Tax=Amycolatopsis sp. NPDC049253 TaxID=3155274 RepID=UPI00342A6DBB